MTKQEKKLYKEAEKIYWKKGSGAVKEWAEKKDLEWAICTECDCEVPVIADTCAICGLIMEFPADKEKEKAFNKILKAMQLADRTGKGIEWMVHEVIKVVSKFDPELKGIDKIPN